MTTYDPVVILHEIDKCVRCRGCVVACKRRSSMTPKTTADYNAYVTQTSGDNVSVDELTVLKSQAYFDMGPMVRYSCWHCYAPTCLEACPFSGYDAQSPSASGDPSTWAIRKLDHTNRAHGAVIVQYTNCLPDTGPCTRQCVSACRAGGYPKIQDRPTTGGTTYYSGKKMNKCDMCYDRVNAGKVPLCVLTCPADALKFDTLQNITDYLNSQRYTNSTLGMRGQVVWASKQGYFQKPKADPYVEDHMSQAVDKLLRGPYARLALVPAGLALGLYALQKRKETQSEEVVVG